MSRVVAGMGMALSLLLLSACQMPDKRPPAAAEACANAQPADKTMCIYTREMYTRVTANFFDYDHYLGQQCDVTIEYSSVYQRYNVIRTQGNEALCLKTWQVIGTAEDLPPPPTNYSKGVVLSFRPAKG
ncbi:cell envelope integrity TolA C-terminal domain-containing protein [Winslowiella iniecta]|uniref:cell envelope integrity TolA C-terminal domain-containing protein n=1 Tax=Winslowiella iniecta TaxID=1560201 RepID=UPI0009E55F8B|nr:cell envelope integrity TolA C-terminal domain-containing protein [Winslowiella iniecta]